MDFRLTSEQKMLQEALTRVTLDAAKAQAPGAAGWQEFVDMGLTAMPFSEHQGGLGATPVETMLVMQAMGQALVHNAWWSSTILAGGMLSDGASAAQRQRWLAPLIDGSLTCAFAHLEPGVTHAQHVIATTATPDGAGWRLTGRKCLVPGGGTAQQLIVAARTSGLPHERTGIDLFVVDADHPQLVRRSAQTFDGADTADLDLQGLWVPADQRLDGERSGWELFEPVFDRANAALCADAVGAMETMLALTIEHVKTRQQFGRALADLQAVQHDLADMYMELELARSMLYYAVWHCDAGCAQQRRSAVSGGKAFICRASRRLGERAIQLHGGIGMTAEYPLGAAFRRCAALTMRLGDTAWHTARLTREGGFVPA